MKTSPQAAFITLIFLSVLEVTVVPAQVRISFPMKPGDVEVYLTTTPYRSSIRHSIRATDAIPQYNFDNNDDTVYIGKFGWFSDKVFMNDYTTVNSKRNITNESAFASYFGWQEIFPLVVPQTDTLMLTAKESLSFNIDTALFIITRRFDTTIFSKTVQAYTMSNLQSLLTKTIADYFGLVTEEFTSDGKTYFNSLTSASINGVQYHWDNRKWNFMPLCIGNTYTYKITWVDRLRGPASYQIMQITGDTLIGAKRYYIMKGDYSPIIQQNNIVFLREDSIGIIKYDQGIERVLVPSNGTIGARGHEGIIRDTSTINFYGKERRVINYFGKWIDGVGLSSITLYSPIGQEYDTLVYAKVCGVEYGTPVSVECVNSIPLAVQLFQNFPNPFSHSTAIGYRLQASGHVRLEVYDLLGRKVATLVDEEKEAGEHSAILNIGDWKLDFHLGVYVYRLQSGRTVLQKKMIVLQ